MHVTLAFFGEVLDARVDEVRERLARAVARASGFALTCMGARGFGARVLAARVEADQPPALVTLARSVAAAARHAGVPVEDRPYRPHVTLARASGQVDLRPLATALVDLRTTTWRPATVDLVRSTLGAGPGRTAAHAVVEAWPLGRGPR
jgi:2'-5' RNA ligase